MKLFNTIALIALAVPFSQAMLMHIDSVQCGHMNVAFNGTAAEIAAIPDYASVTVNGVTQMVRMPSVRTPPPTSPSVTPGTIQTFYLMFANPFVVPDGYYNTNIVLTTQVGDTAPVANFTVPAVQFMGCGTAAAASTAASVVEAAQATVTFDPNYVATASPATTTSEPYEVPFYSPVGLPTSAPAGSSVNAGTTSDLSSGAKAGIAVAVLAVALMAIAGAVFALVRRRRNAKMNNEEAGSGSLAGARARRHVSQKWVNDGEELKEVASPSMV